MKISHLILICFLFVSCEKDNNKAYLREGYIVGFDPCTIRNNYDTGYVIITTDLKDTLMTYNFPDTIFSFPSEYFLNYINSGYFPVEARYEFKIRITYSVAKESEKIYNLCTADINLSEFNNALQVITKSASKY